MYGIDGREDLPEEELSHLEGYMGSAPVRIGNQAAGIVKLFENTCGSVDVSGLCGGT
jgi:GH15 family glucan-1,4-alpha-glucosidase